MTNPIAAAAVEYVAAGWKLTPIPRGTKGPTSDGWNLRGNVVADVVRASTVTTGVGLCHAYSGTMALDIDDWALAEPWLAERGVDLNALWTAPDAVQLLSGRAGRGKLIYSCPAPFASKRPKGSGLELRCATSAGLTVQDVLPPSIHPDTGKPYAWGGPGDWRKLPAMPAELGRILEQLSTPAQEPTAKEPTGADIEHQRQLLRGLDPDCGYDEWIRVGMALHHENRGGHDGFVLWDDWSAQSAKYPGTDKLLQHWHSFGNTEGPVVTLRSLGGTAAASDFEDVEPDPDETPEAERFKFVPAPDYAAARRPEWIIKGVLPRAGLAVVYGDSGSGKTFAVLDMMACVVRGIDWRGHRVRRGKVAYLCGEGSDFFARRIKAYQHENPDCDLSDMLVCAESPNLLKQSPDYKLLSEQLKAIGDVSIVVIDTLARSMPGGNENASEDMSVLVDRCGRIHKATGALVLLVHHTGKDAAKGARGHSSLRAAADAELAVFRDVENATRRIELGKQKDGPDGNVYPFALQEVILGMDDDGDLVHSCVVVDPTSAEQTNLGDDDAGTDSV